jgi:8-oxo-dGTP pyrophosphatase MutT (NUDIX family)
VDETPPYADAIRAVAEETGSPLADTRAYVLSLPDWGSMLEDGVHQTPELDALIAKNVTAPALAPIIASMLCAR